MCSMAKKKQKSAYTTENSQPVHLKITKMEKIISTIHLHSEGLKGHEEFGEIPRLHGGSGKWTGPSNR